MRPFEAMGRKAWFTGSFSLDTLEEQGVCFCVTKALVLVWRDLVAKHRPFSLVVRLPFPEQLSAFLLGIFVFLLVSLHAAYRRRKGTFSCNFFLQFTESKDVHH